MKHLTLKQWIRYVNNELPDETRATYETHLYECDECMEVYLHVIEASEFLPDVSQDVAFTDAIMSQICDVEEHTNKRQKQRPFYEKTIFHYCLAASITILLMSSGVFQSITNYIEDVQSSTISSHAPSITEQLLQRAFSQDNDGN